MIRVYRVSRAQLLDVQVALIQQINYCLDNARSEPSVWVSRSWCAHAARYVRAYRAIAGGGRYGRWCRHRADMWAKEITFLLLRKETEQSWTTENTNASHIAKRESGDK